MSPVPTKKTRKTFVDSSSLTGPSSYKKALRVIRSLWATLQTGLSTGSTGTVIPGSPSTEIVKPSCLDAKHDAAESRSAESEGTKALRALNMELLDGGGIPGFDRFHRKTDRCQIPGILGRIEIDRNAAQLFGLVTVGAHMACYTWESSKKGRQMKLFVPRRAENKAYDAGKLDNTVAGGVVNGDNPLQTILAEAWEEAALSRDFVTENIKATSILSYYNQGSAAEGGHMRPRVLHTFELELPHDMVPRPHDGEVSEFLRMDAQEARETIMAGEMTDDAAIVWLDFLVRHGIVDEQNEPDLLQITGRMHRHLPFSTIMA